MRPSSTAKGEPIWIYLVELAATVNKHMLNTAPNCAARFAD